MSHESFMKLHDVIFEDKAFANKGPNGGIDTRLKLSVSLRHFAGGDPLDIMASHGVSHSIMFNVIWDVADAVNRCPKLSSLSHPSDHRKQEEIAAGFKAKSAVRFGNCCGAVDGLLVETEKPARPN